ncbi:MAG TPA: signal recognition particle protein [Blastocatellia bacterium]|nr:signal recognition particle protein [Blastocatellia bacterium]HMV82120.1 signal recognition particle protein [Blastocatellia bacterium]HMX27555.1 signal recognition particle protein [Blastocatellia bacterium]HMY75260.1 signal recognition particle protein [Blastocatellia bacterium]HNG29091.1 signal recognition particle protein [Blastocatellia bacterium]
MFDALSDKLKKVLKDLRGESRLTPEHLDLAMREIRIALLEADVNFKVVKDFVERVKTQAVGQEVLDQLSPGQQVVKVVHDEMVSMLGGTSSRLLFTSRRPNSVMIVGLQGSGKTTSTGKLSRWLYKNQNRNPLLLSVDVYRPAARAQLAVIGKALNIPVFAGEGMDNPLELVKAARTYCEQVGFDTLMIDTAGRLHIDDTLMEELQRIKSEMQPVETLFVADAMTGQDAVKSAKEFHDKVGITGVILTKMDGDTRGGAALSIKEVIGQPIKFVGTGEKYDALEPFYPERIVSRILGMGDVLSLIEKVQEEVDEEKAQKLQEKLEQNAFTLEDFRDQLGQMKKLGSLESILSMLPGDMFKGMPKMTPEMSEQMEGELKRTEAIINSMTMMERENHLIITQSRRRRIAMGSGTKTKDVDNLLKQYVEMKMMMQQLMGGDGFMGGMRGKVVRKLTGLGARKKHKKQQKKKKKR